MPILDTNVFTQIAKGNVPVAEAFLRMIRNAGSRPLYVSRAAYNSLVLDSPTQALRDGYRAIIDDLDLDIAPVGARADRVDLYRDNIQYEPGPNQLGRIDQYGKGAAKERPGDMFIAAEAKSLKTELWTLDAPFAKRAANQGVMIAPESALPYVAGVENIALARRLLKLRVRINLKLPNLANLRIKLSSIKTGIRSAVQPQVLRRQVLRPQVLRGLGVALLETAIFAVIGALVDGWQERKYIREGLKLVTDYINDKLPDFAPEIGWLQLRLEEGEKVYLNYHIEIHIECGESGHKWPAYPDKYRDLQIMQGQFSASVWLADSAGMEISTKYKESDSTEKLGILGMRGTIKHFIRSAEVAVFTPEELAAFNEATGQYLELKRKLAMGPRNSVWIEEAAALRQQLVEALGEDLWFLELEKQID
jgi:predicted nucleic acid-binding protein